MGYRLWVIGLCALGLSACATYDIAIDDAYHWEEKSSYTPSTTHKTSQSSATSTTPAVSPSSAETSSSGSKEPAIEYIHVEDTTVTIRIQR